MFSMTCVDRRAISSAGERSSAVYRLPDSGVDIAFRAADDEQQAQMAEKLMRKHGQRPTEQKDRKYFRSIYFRGLGGVLFEIATDIPGFAVDEPVETLGRELKLPKFLEPRRNEIESVLPVLEQAAS